MPFVHLQGRGGGRIPTETTSIQLSRSELSQVMQRVAANLYPHLGHSEALRRMQQNPNAACLIREAATQYTTQ